MDTRVVWSLEGAISRNIATVLKEVVTGASSSDAAAPVQRLAELIRLEANGTPVIASPLSKSMTPEHFQIASQLESAVRAAVLVVLRSKSAWPMSVLADALDDQWQPQAKPASLVTAAMPPPDETLSLDERLAGGGGPVAETPTEPDEHYQDPTAVALDETLSLDERLAGGGGPVAEAPTEPDEYYQDPTAVAGPSLTASAAPSLIAAKAPSLMHLPRLATSSDLSPMSAPESTASSGGAEPTGSSRVEPLGGRTRAESRESTRTRAESRESTRTSTGSWRSDNLEWLAADDPDTPIRRSTLQRRSSIS